MAQSVLLARDRAVKLQMMISFKGDFDSALRQTFNCRRLIEGSERRRWGWWGGGVIGCRREGESRGMEKVEAD